MTLRRILVSLALASAFSLLPVLPAVADPGPHLCGAPEVGMSADSSMWHELVDVARRHGWDVP